MHSFYYKLINLRQGEFLHGLAVVYESIYEIHQWWIGLTDLGTLKLLFVIAANNYSHSGQNG